MLNIQKIQVIPMNAVLIEDARFGVSQAVRLDVIDDVALGNLKVIAMGFHKK